MSFQESGQTPEFATQKVNDLMANWLQTKEFHTSKKGLVVLYPGDGKINTEVIRDAKKLKAIYKICNSNSVDIFYLLQKIYLGQVPYSDFAYFVEIISDTLNKINETSYIKSEKEREAAKRILSMNMRKFTTDARLKLRITK